MPRPRRAEERFWTKVHKGGPDDCWVWTARPRPDGYGRIRLGGKGSPFMAAHRFSWELANGPVPDGLFVCHTCDIRHEPGSVKYRLCVNPRHLVVGTAAENSAHMAEVGRAAVGERHGSRLHPERLRRGDNHPWKTSTAALRRGDDHWTRRMPERLARGDRNGARIHRDRMPRGDRNGLRLHPESVLRGEKAKRAVFTDDQVRSIKAQLRSGVTVTFIARELGVGRTTVQAIKTGQNWAWIE